MILGILSLMICIGIPAGGAVWFLAKRNGTFLSFLAGVLAFAISQLLIRIPLLNFLSSHVEWMMILPMANFVLYCVFLAFTAGLSEETARWLGLKYGRRGKTGWVHGFAFGLGHGGIEAVWVAFQGLVPALLNGTLFLFGENAILVALERLGAMTFHIGMTLIVLEGIRTRRLRWLALAILLHFLLDVSIAFQNAAVNMAVLAAGAAGSVAVMVLTYRKWKKEGEK